MILISSRRLLTYGLIATLLVVIVSLSRSLYQTFSLMQEQKKIDQEIIFLQKEGVSLTKVLEEKQSSEYLEKVARDKLLMVKPGEKMVVLPAADNQNQSETLKGQKDDLLRLSNIAKWQRLFFP